jgi:23S rRNA pseudouridine1911/1915/1917 synthase
MDKTSEKIQLTISIPSELTNMRLDQALSQLLPNYSRSLLQTWIRDKQVSVDGKFCRPRDKVLGNESIVINSTLPVKINWEAESMLLDIIYEDESLLVINKPVGLVVHPGSGNWHGTLVNALLHYAPNLAQLPRAGLIHRLDKETSGLLIIAKTIEAHTFLIQEMQNRTIRREYEAIVNGTLTAGATIHAAIGRHPVHRQRMAVVENGKPATTHFRVLEKFRAFTHIKVKLETGRTHQIRVHMSHIHHPLAGDKTYGGYLKIPPKISIELLDALRQFKHQALHARYLKFTHPITNELVECTAPLPTDMQALLTLLRKDKTCNS